MVSQALVDHPCLFRQQPTDQDVHISRVCFLEQEYDKQPPAGSLQQNQRERLFSGVPHASGITPSSLEELMHFCDSHDVTPQGSGR